MFATVSTPSLPHRVRRSFEDSFDTFVPSRSPEAERAAARTLEMVRRQTIDSWMSRLPSFVRPHRLAMRFPREIMQIIERWDNRSAAAMVIDELLLNSQIDRKWLMPEVFAELDALARYVRLRHTEGTPARR